jgi:hypothetical protein
MADLLVSPVSPASPKKGGKKKSDDDYRLSVKEFGALLKEFVVRFNSLMTLATMLAGTGKGSYLVFQENGRSLQFGRKQLRSANAKFAQELLELKNYLRVSKRKTRAVVDPSSFKGTYAPIYAGAALRNFFNSAPANFGSLDPSTNDPRALMDFLPYVKAGYMMRNSSTMLFYIYAHSMDLLDKSNGQFAVSDAVLTASFGGSIPADFDYDANKSKVPMANYATPINTYDLIAAKRPPGSRDKKGRDIGFRPERYPTFFYQSMGAANYYSKRDLEEAGKTDAKFLELKAQLDSPDVRDQMLAEHNIIKETSKAWGIALSENREQRKKQKDALKKLTKK